MSDGIKELEAALRSYEAAEVYFENAYISYRLARKYLDEQEALINELRKKVNIEHQQVVDGEVSEKTEQPKDIPPDNTIVYF